MMTTGRTNGAPRRAVPTRGLGVAILSSAAFATSGVLAKPLLEAGWSSGAAVLLRIGGSALVLLVPCLVLVLRTRGRMLRDNRHYLIGYGVLAIAGTQIGFFSAIQTLPIGVALLIEYLAPVVVVGWLWVRRGQAPTRRTVMGAAVAMTGLALVLNPGAGMSLDPVGVAWALLAMVCLVGYFLLSATVPDDLPPVVVIGSGMVIGWLVLAGCAAVGLLAVEVGSEPTVLAGAEVPWAVPAIGLVLFATVFAYLSGIVAAQRLGSRLVSFVALIEVVFATALAWLVVDQAPVWQQVVGGLLVIAGVVLVRLGEPPTDPLAAIPDDISPQSRTSIASSLP